MEHYWHLGAHRTGSTAFQRILAKNAGALAAEGIVAWGPDELRAMAHFYLPESAGLAPGAAGSFATDLAGVNARVLVLSEENMIGSMRLNLLQGAFYDDMAIRLDAYRALTGHAPTRIGLGIRDYAAYWASAYSYLLPRHDLPRFDELKRPLLRLRRGWLDVLSDLRVLFPEAEIMVWPLETIETRMRAMVACFLGVDRHAIEPIKRRINVSRGSEVVAQVHALRAAHPGIGPDELHEKLQTAPPLATPAPPLFADEDILALTMRYADEIATLDAGFEGVRLIQKPGQCK